MVSDYQDQNPDRKQTTENISDEENDEADISIGNDGYEDDEDFESETMNISQNSEDINDEESSKGLNL
jgi:hypothetical protein